MHDHGHHHHHDAAGRALVWTMALNLAIPACQIVGGIMAQSMAVVSDAVHNFSDFTSLLVAYVALRIARRAPSRRFTYGFRRAEILAALLNVALIAGACAFILWESVQRMLEPTQVSGALVAILAGVGVLGNGASVVLLHRGGRGNLNMRGALLHMLGDLLTSVVVLVTGLVLLYRPWYWLDPLLSVLIVAFILWNSWSVLKEAGRILMEGAPTGLDLDRVRDRLEQEPEVVSAHHLHAWSVGSESVFFTGHVQVQDQALSSVAPLGDRLRRVLLTEFSIDHAVFEFESAPCGDNPTLCCRGEENCPGR